MTLKQFARYRFFQLIEAYRVVKADLSTEKNRHAFIVLSVQLHAAKAGVPKSYWSLINGRTK
jgi:hypothetical protein